MDRCICIDCVCELFFSSIVQYIIVSYVRQYVPKVTLRIASYDIAIMDKVRMVAICVQR